MKLDKEMSEVIAELEYEVGSECYNPCSYDGWNDIEGCDFRYPINFPKADGVYTKIKTRITNSFRITSEDITPETVPFMKYKFGANELMIGRGLINVLDFLEDRYGLSFNELENEFRSKKSSKDEDD